MPSPQPTSEATLRGARIVSPAITSGAGQYLAGQQAQANYDNVAAARYYKSALFLDSGNVDLARRTWYHMLVSGQDKEAAVIARMALEGDSHAAVAAFVVAADFVAKNEWDKARAALKPLKKKGLNAFAVPLAQAWIWAGLGKPKKALRTLAPMRRKKQLRPLHDFHAGLIWEVSGQPEKAWTWYKHIAQAPSLSLRAVEVLAHHLRRVGKPQQALDLFERYRQQSHESLLVDVAERAYQQNASSSRPVLSAQDGLAEAFHGIASSVAQGHAWDATLVFSRLALFVRPDFPYAHMMVGETFFEQEKWAESIQALGAVPQGSPLSWPAYLKMAEALEHSEKHDAARQTLKKLIQSYPKNGEAHMVMGDLERRQENWPAAIAAYQQALHATELAEKASWPIHYSLGVALERNGQWAAAEEHLLKALKQKPNHPMILNYLGYSWIDRGINLERGKELIAQAVSQRPEDGFIVDSLGWALFLLGNYSEAVSHLERAVELEPSDPTINEHLGDAYWQAGRQREARFQWNKALSFDPDLPMREKIEDKLEFGLETH